MGDLCTKLMTRTEAAIGGPARSKEVSSCAIALTGVYGKINNDPLSPAYPDNLDKMLRDRFCQVPERQAS
ncbi:MAG: hypothetical protein Alpg2KO_18350 [Alphaproteobacteria bacterium]